MEFGEQVTLLRDCPATLIPYGARIVLKQGDHARITQALGGSYTVLVNGGLYRIEPTDADAIGKSSAPAPTATDGRCVGTFREAAVWDMLKSCYDPEIPVNIVDLGLVYSCECAAGLNGTHVTIQMTLTAPGCGMGGILADEVKQKVKGLPGVADAEVRLVWEPQWSREMMTEEAKLMLGML